MKLEQEFSSVGRSNQKYPSSRARNYETEGPSGQGRRRRRRVGFSSADEEGEEEEEEVSFIGHEKSLGGILMGGSAHSSRRHLGRDADTGSGFMVVVNLRFCCKSTNL